MLRDGPLGAFDVDLPARASCTTGPSASRGECARKIRARPRRLRRDPLPLRRLRHRRRARPRACARKAWRASTAPHCYAFYAGEAGFDAMMEEEPGTFFLTDFLARHFDALVIEGLGLDRFPQLRDDYFGNYRRLVYLAQIDDPRADREGARRPPRGSASPSSGASPGLAASRRSSRARRPRASSVHGQPDHPLLARHSEPGHRQGRARVGQARIAGALHPRDRRRRDARGRQRAPTPISPIGGAASPTPCGDDLEAEASAAAARLEAEYDTHRLAGSRQA